MKRYLQFKVYQDDLGNFEVVYGKVGRGEEALKDFKKELLCKNNKKKEVKTND